MKFSEIQAELRHFAAERDWQPFHTPKNLSTALMVEAAELAEIFQWMTPDQSLAAAFNPDEKQRIGDEVADVLFYLLQLADHCQIDIAKAATEKLTRIALKYPALRAITRVSPSHAVVPGSHILLDYENVQPTEEELRSLAPGASHVWLFHGPHQRQVVQRFVGYGNHVTAVPISKTGKNALDFHLSFYMGYIASRNPSASLIVVANDRGYEPMLEHARAMGFSVRQVGHGNAIALKLPDSAQAAKATKPSKPAAKKAPAKSAPTKKTKPAAAKKTRAATPTPVKKTSPAKKSAAKQSSPTTKRAAAPAPAKTPKPAPRVTTKHLTDSLRKMGANRATKPKSLWRALKSFLGPDNSDQVVKAELDRLIGSGVVRVDSEKGVSYPIFAA